MIDVIVGLQRGDEGKGRFVDLAAADYDIVARGNGGANAGHTVVVEEEMIELALHQVPSGIAYRGKLNVIGNGVYLDPVRLVAELEDLQSKGIEVTRDNLLISHMAHLVMPHHVVLDCFREGGSSAQGSTKAGIAYVASDKYERIGMRLESAVSDPRGLYQHAREQYAGVRPELSRRAHQWRIHKWMQAVDLLKPFMADTVEVINEALDEGQKVLAEGAQAYWLDINHGMYPMVTSSSTTVNGLMDGLGVSHKRINKVTGVAKVVTSHVGGGPFVTEVMDEELALQLRGERDAPDSEYGATTKRARRVGYPDFVQLRNAVRGNGVDEVVLSKMDHADRFGETMLAATAYMLDGESVTMAPKSAPELEACVPEYVPLNTWSGISTTRQYSRLPKAAHTFVELAEEQLGLPVTQLGVGYERNQVIRRRTVLAD